MKINQKQIVSTEPVWSSYIHAKGAALGLPIAGNFELTAKCNFGCKMCYVHTRDKSEELTAEQWINLGEQATEKGMIFLLLTGGEPFLREDFLEIYAALKKLGLLISINTNGSLINDEIFEFLVKNPPIRMNISLYGCSNETYMKLCGKPVFDKVIHNIMRLHEAGISIRINSSIVPDNVNDIQKLYQIAECLGIPIKATTYMFPPVRINGGKYGEALHRFSAQEAGQYMLMCQEQYMTPYKLAENYKEKIFKIKDNYIEGENMYCRAGKSAFWITWDGRMLPCGMFHIKGFPVEKNGFEYAWYLVREFTKKIKLPSECRGCLYKKKCAACAAACLAETGRTDIKPEYICEMTKYQQQLGTIKYGE